MISASMNKVANSECKGRLLYDEVLAKYTSWRVGGKADCLYFPSERDDLVSFIKSLKKEEPVLWMGMGSNLLIRDGGIRGTVINTRGCLKEMYKAKDGTIYVEAGIQCARVARFCGDNGLTGAEFLAGIPGTMGGALKMNAGAFGHETWGIVNTVDVCDLSGTSRTRKAEEYKVGYRTVEGPGQEWFLSANLKLAAGETKASQIMVKELLAKRAQTQPVNQPSCGSVFRNPEGDFAARLIEASNLKGYCIGGACVSEKHANFIINTGQACASDIEALIIYVQEQIELKQGVCLQTEVCIVGEHQ